MAQVARHHSLLHPFLFFFPLADDLIQIRRQVVLILNTHKSSVNKLPVRKKKKKQVHKHFFYLLVFCPLVLGKELVLHGQIQSSLDAEHSVIVYILREPPQGLLHIAVLVYRVVPHQTCHKSKFSFSSLI